MRKLYVRGKDTPHIPSAWVYWTYEGIAYRMIDHVLHWKDHGGTWRPCVDTFIA